MRLADMEEFQLQPQEEGLDSSLESMGRAGYRQHLHHALVEPYKEVLRLEQDAPRIPAQVLPVLQPTTAASHSTGPCRTTLYTFLSTMLQTEVPFQQADAVIVCTDSRSLDDPSLGHSSTLFDLWQSGVQSLARNNGQSSLFH